ncbi:hypothetical protein INT46_010184 [Mucor plumbeus]|uniref:GPI anchored serine-threonine rich protein n=1 Tax=Mucor plumbeus TaxID=97098 RepID=A0A8H7QYY8_9FUNG|nr:hypothetical protein INT46_010184 [Mucor plumbeus]
MKVAVVGFLVALTASVSAQQANSTVPSSSSAAPVVAATTASAAAVPSTVSACAVQSTFELCLQNEDNYIKTCLEQDFACLCRWNKEKLTCWNNCPNDEGLARQEGVVSNFCSMPGANVSIAPWTSTIASTSTPVLPTSVVATSVSAVPTTPTNQPSSASILAISQGALTLVGVAAAYMLF